MGSIQNDMKPLLAILIPYTPDRQQLLDRVLAQVGEQMGDHPIKVITNLDNKEKSTGVKRNELLYKAREIEASHIAFVDSDDLIGPTYIQRNMEAVYGDYDCCELWGQYYENGKQLNPFHHSIIHDHWWQDDKFYYRNPNHLNCIKLELLKDIRFQDKTVGEDGHYSIDIQKAGLLKNEFKVNEITYFYFKNGNHNQDMAKLQKRGIKL